MRKLTLGVLALGCLVLGLSTFVAPNSTTPLVVKVSAAVPSDCFQPCSFGDPDEKDKADHFTYCHVDHGGDPHVNCSDSSSINHPHLDTHEFDFCINSTEDLQRCFDLKIPPPK